MVVRRTDGIAGATVITLPETTIVAPRIAAAPRPTLEASIAAATTMPAGMQSVGRGGANRPEDVEFVRSMLAMQFPDNAAIQAPFSTPITAAERSALTNAIVSFQDRENIAQRNGHGDGLISIGSSGTTKPTMTRLRALTTEAVTTRYSAQTAALEAASHTAPPAGPIEGGASGSAGTAPVAATGSRTTAERIFLDFPAAQRAGSVVTEEILGGGHDIAEGWNRNNFGQIMQGIGSGAGGIVRMVGSVASYPIGLVGNLATRASDAMWDETKSLWERGGAGNITLAILLAIPTFLLKAVAMAFNAAAAIIDGIFKFFGETVVEGLINWVGEAMGGRRKNESDIRAGVREAEEDARETAEEQARIRDNEVSGVREQAQAQRNREIRNAESELSTMRGTLANNQRTIARLNAIPAATRTSLQAVQLANAVNENAALGPAILAQEQTIANLRAAPLPEPATPAVTGNGVTPPPSTVPNPA